jgi:hypothetical protein
MLSDLLDLFPTLILCFSSPKMQAPAPMPANPGEDPEQIRQRENASRQAAVDLAAGGRRSTVFAGGRIAQDAQTARARKRLGYAAGDLDLG